jgi:hypothetical protein
METWGSVKVFFGTSCQIIFESQLIFTISLREIVKMSWLSRENSAAEGGKRFFAQPLSVFI